MFRAKAVLFATGGYGRMFKVSSNAHALTGDGPAVLFRRGLPLEDMEFFQFHPTGVYKLGILLSEAVRGEGGILLNNDGERFMERYAPTIKDLAPRDMVSRAIYQEIKEGRGDRAATRLRSTSTCATSPREVIEEKLPDMTEFARVYLGVEPTTELVPIQPTAHYAMGGIPTDIDGRVVVGEDETPVPGLYAAGECACVSVHGANRLGTNSLLDIVVFGRRGGEHMAAVLRGRRSARRSPNAPRRTVREMVDGLLAGTEGDERRRTSATSSRTSMLDLAFVVRTEESLREDAGDPRRPARALRPRRRCTDKGSDVQHRPDGGGRARLPARLRRRARGGGARARPRAVAATTARTTRCATTRTG